MPEEQQTSSERLVSRRQVLQGVGAGGLAMMLAGKAPGLLRSPRAGMSGVGDVVMWWQAYGTTPTQWSNFVNGLGTQFAKLKEGSVTTTVVPWSAALQKWALAMANGSNPNIGDMFYLQSRFSRPSNAPLDITSQVNSGDFGDWGRFVPVAQRESSYLGKVYAIPWRIDIRTIVYYEDLWKPVTTLSEFEAQALDLTGKHNLRAVAGLVGGATSYQALCSVAAMWDVQWLTPDLTKSALKDPRWAEACNWAQKMVKQGVFLTSDVLNKESVAGASLDSREVAMTFGGNISIAESVTTTSASQGKLIKASLMPVVPGVGKPIGIASTAQYSIFNNTADKETALDYVKFLASANVAAAISTASVTQSADITVQDKDPNPLHKPFYQTSRTALGIDMPSPHWAQMTAATGPYTTLAAAIFSGQNVTSSINTAYEATQAILNG
jgi:ABC-type glycerol-3-phosphate transport system substrate-binding protein